MKKLLKTTLLASVLAATFIEVRAQDNRVTYVKKEMVLTTVHDKAKLDDDKLADFDAHGSDDGRVGAGADKDSVLSLLDGEKEQTHRDITVYTEKHVHGNGH